jgi:hypothetical protein
MPIGRLLLDRRTRGGDRPKNPESHLTETQPNTISRRPGSIGACSDAEGHIRRQITASSRADAAFCSIYSHWSPSSRGQSNRFAEYKNGFNISIVLHTINRLPSSR